MPGRMLVNVRKLSISFLHKSLLENLSFSVEKGRLLVLIGPNGCGKSTILNLLASKADDRVEDNGIPDIRIRGEISLASSLRVLLLPQNLRNYDSDLLQAAPARGELASHVARLSEAFVFNERKNRNGILSDGELQKRAIVNALLQDPDLFLLDEPTNFLDIAGITAFEEQILLSKEQGKGIILVTHDRTLADNVADETILLGEEGVYRSSGGASAAWSVRQGVIRSRESRAKELRKKIRRLQEDIRAKSGWAAAKERQIIGGGGSKGHISHLAAKMAKRAKVAQRRAQREMARLSETKPFVPKQVNLSFPQREIRNRRVFSLLNISFDYGPDQGADRAGLLSNLTLSAGTKDKLCLMGANGSGKSTILKLAQRLLKPGRGKVQLNRNISTAYVPQGLVGFFTHERLLDNFRETQQDETTVRRFLGGALIRKEKTGDLLGSFSYGELMRAAIVKCILSGSEFLFLDEPTSHLDIESIEVLEQLLSDFAGGFLMISHDRSFVANTAETIYLIDSGRLRLV